jgi:cell division protein ZapA (FtsZ GTPase activity inhibitor)
MKNEARKYKISIFHHEYTIVSDESEEQIHKAAAYVDMLMKEIVQKAPHADKGMISVLAAVRIAHNLLAAEDKILESSCKLAQLAHSIDSLL